MLCVYLHLCTFALRKWQSAMQRHDVPLELSDGITQIVVGISFLCRGHDIVLRLARYVEAAVPEGDTLLRLGALHNIRRGP